MKKKFVSVMMASLMLAISLCGCGSSSSGSSGNSGKQTLVVVDWGGALQDAHRKAIFEPFEKKYNVTIKEVSPTDYSTVTAMCKSGKIEYDVINVQPDYALRMEDYLEPIDYDVVDNSSFDKKWYGDTWVASDLYATAIVYNTDEFSDSHPETWSDFWDTDKYPGKRTLWNYPTGMLEAALLADGVDPDDLYPLDVDRAFKSLDKIKPSVVKWWETGAESIQLVSNNEAAVGALWGSRVDSAKSEGQHIDVDYTQAIIGADAWVVPKGSKNTDLAMEFINFATRAEQMAEFMKLYPNGSVNLDAYDMLDQETLDKLATNPDKADSQIMMDDSWWVENGDDVVERFNKWLLE